jgi:uncharacterized protein (TIGR00297 family)
MIVPPIAARALAGLLIAGAVAYGARRTGALSASGAVVATGVGACAAAAGWSWAELLVIYFVAATALSRVGRDAKERRTASLVQKGGERDGVQVLANGALFAASCLLSIVRPDVVWIALGAGSLAASASDTWATEIGTLYGGEPRSILGGRRVPAGTSGAVSLIGSVAALAGALFTAGVLRLLGWTSPVAASVAAGGVAGALVDTLLGATVQSRRWCAACNRGTERVVHDCGAATQPSGGLAWLDNDMVNFVAGVAGGLLAAILIRAS